VRGGLLFLIGIAVGLLIAPQTGPELRARIQAKLADRAGGLPAEEDYSL
jgi:gas vesicle protein